MYVRFVKLHYKLISTQQSFPQEMTDKNLHFISQFTLLFISFVYSTLLQWLTLLFYSTISTTNSSTKETYINPTMKFYRTKIFQKSPEVTLNVDILS